MRTVYKVVWSEYDGRLVSARIAFLPWERVYRSAAGRRYWVGHCMAFRTLKQAQAFADPLEQIWEAECESARAIRHVVHRKDPELFRSFQAHGGRKNAWWQDCMKAPPGTLYCHNLRLVRRLDDEEES